MSLIRLLVLSASAAALSAGLVLAEDTAAPSPTDIEVTGGQATIPVGVTLIVKKITVADDATVLNVVISFDGDVDSVELGYKPVALDLGNNQRLLMRAISDNPELVIEKGQTLAGDLVFPWVIPPDTQSVTLIFNEGNMGSDISFPGLKLPLSLRKAE